MAFVIGIDIGSAASKGMITDDRKTLGTMECPSGGDFRLTAERIRSQLLSMAGLVRADIARVVATGFGAQMVTYADDLRTEITCHAKGVAHIAPSARTVVDVGDLYTKVFRINDQGNVVNFLLSGKCAGGSGRILQIIAKVLQLEVEEIGELSLKSKHRVDFNTGCVVFAESEAVSRIAEGVAKEDLLAAIHRALAAQINSLAERITIEPALALVGGGARDVGLVKAMEEITGAPVLVPPDPHMTAALGAALFAQETMA